jgi:hypothetical protein
MEINLPEPGFYYHYKHDPEKDLNNYAYEVVSSARHTEEENLLVLYRPLYETNWYKPATYNARPLDMFVGEVEKDGKTFLRFTQITDPETITKLTEIRNEMYPS